MSLKDMAGMVAVGLTLLGLVWNAAIEVRVNEEQSTEIADLKRAQAVDHDDVTRMKAGIDYLVEKAKERESAK